MRAFRELMSALGVALSVAMVASQWNKLPPRVPLHFDWAGHASGWGSPHAFALFPIVAVLMWVLLTVIPRYPQTFNYPMDAVVCDRTRLAPLAVDMLGWIKLETSWMFAGLTWSALRAAHGEGVTSVLLIVALGVSTTVATAIVYGIRMRHSVAQ